MSPLEEFMGAFLIQVFLGLILHGINLAQTYLYWLNRKRDPIILQCTVLVVALLEAIHSIFTMHMTYYYLIAAACGAGPLTIVWSAGPSLIAGILIPAITQLFYTRRIWILSRKNRIITPIVLTFVIIRTGTALATCIFTYFLDTVSQIQEEPGPRITFSITIAFSAGTDILIAGILVYLLHQSRTGYKDTDHILEKIMVWVVQTGIITVLSTITVVFLFIFMKDSMAFTGQAFVTDKLYSNSLLAVLNARNTFRKGSAFGSTELRNRTVPSPHTAAIEIFKETSRVTDREFERGKQLPVADIGDDGDSTKVVDLT